MEFKNLISTIDTVTEGGPTRIITSGLPVLHGKSMQEKMIYFQNNFEDIRKMLMLEPSGYLGMFGAVITEPMEDTADIGVFFLTSSGYLTMCVHSAIGIVAAMLETGMCARPEKGKSIKLDTPVGIIPLQPNYTIEQLSSISIQTNPAFVYKKDVLLDLKDNKSVKVSLVFSAVFFVLVDINSLGIDLTLDNISELKAVGVEILNLANEQFEFSHPNNADYNKAELIMLFEEIGNAHSRNAVISRNSDLDRSPCGAGTGAKMAYLFALNKLKLNQTFINESIFDTKFTGELIDTCTVGKYQAVVPQITGSANITGFHQFVSNKTRN